MRRIIQLLIVFYRKSRSVLSTFLLKRQIVSYGYNIGAARFPKIARSAKVLIGNNCSFNGITITGCGGGENRFIFSLWNQCEDYAWKP